MDIFMGWIGLRTKTSCPVMQAEPQDGQDFAQRQKIAG